ncbi:MAG: sulfite oxidase-like oxidoreductase [Chloroflexi bacterium]|nr:sulfite oxidase-like oxidoreductase [Chloroflexota bacterium]
MLFLNRAPFRRSPVVFDLIGRRSKDREKYGDRLPPNQKAVDDWPVLTYGAAPRVDLAGWRLRVFGEVEEEREFTWEQFIALPRVTVVSDAHCVTAWSKFDNQWEGVAFREVAELVRPKPEAEAVMAHCYGGYTTNILLDDLLRDDVLFAYKHNGRELPAEHGGPLRLVVPHLYFWKSAKWVKGLEFMDRDHPGFWEMYGYHLRGDPWKEERYS